MSFPKDIAGFIERRSQHDGSVDLCASCDAHCCAGPGFALLENVIEIFKLYQDGCLYREDHRFQKGLSFCDFIWRYFDRAVHNDCLLTFFPKTFADNGSIVSVPPWDYYRQRTRIGQRAGKKGCVFLSRMLDAHGTNMNPCILHSATFREEITAKPIDCVFQACSSNRRIVRPSDQETAEWILLLHHHFPDSLGRFRELCPGMPDQRGGVWPSDEPRQATQF
jgi:hypothetical protein